MLFNFYIYLCRICWNPLYPSTCALRVYAAWIPKQHKSHTAFSKGIGDKSGELYLIVGLIHLELITKQIFEFRYHTIFINIREGRKQKSWICHLLYAHRMKKRQWLNKGIRVYSIKSCFSWLKLSFSLIFCIILDKNAFLQWSLKLKFPNTFIWFF